MDATRFWFVLAATASTIAMDTSQDYNFSLNLGDISPFTLNTSTVYTFNVAVSTVNGTTGAIFQVHSQRINITLSSDFPSTQRIQGTDVGLYVPVNSTIKNVSFHANVSCSLYCNGTLESIKVLVAVTSLVDDHPIPGGCTLTSAISPDPNLQLNYSSYFTSLIFQNGNVGRQPTPSCYATSYIGNQNWESIEYQVYSRFLKWKDYSEEGMIEALKAMLTPEKLDSNKGLGSVSVGPSDLKLMTFDTFQGDAVVYNVLAIDIGSQAVSAYVPAISYACTFEAGKPGCQVASSLVNKIISPVIALVGLFLCLLAHRLFHVEVFVFSWVIMAVPWYMLLLGVADMSHAVTVSVSLACSLVTAAMLFLLWMFSGAHLPFVFLFNACSGFLIAAIVLFTPVGAFAVFKISYVYALLFLCLMVVFLIPAVLFPRALNIFSSAFIGSYLIIFAVGMFIFTSLTEVVLRVIKCTTIGGYLSTEVNYPFELNDIILTCVWLLLLVLGVIVQAGLARGREKFPPNLFKQIKAKLRRNKTSGATGERKRLVLGAYTDSLSANPGSTYGAIGTHTEIATQPYSRLH